jgi:uncharacterized membrane protein
MEKSRLEAFSDGVFAIVITLLILDIRFPDVAYRQFATTLVSLLPRILAYVLSFVIIGYIGVPIITLCTRSKKQIVVSFG